MSFHYIGKRICSNKEGNEDTGDTVVDGDWRGKAVEEGDKFSYQACSRRISTVVYLAGDPKKELPQPVEEEEDGIIRWNKKSYDLSLDAKKHLMDNVHFLCPRIYFWLRPEVALQSVVINSLRSLCGYGSNLELLRLASESPQIMSSFKTFWEVVKEIYWSAGMAPTSSIPRRHRNEIILAMIEVMHWDEHNKKHNGKEAQRTHIPHISEVDTWERLGITFPFISNDYKVNEGEAGFLEQVQSRNCADLSLTISHRLCTLCQMYLPSYQALKLHQYPGKDPRGKASDGCPRIRQYNEKNRMRCQACGIEAENPVQLQIHHHTFCRSSFYKICNICGYKAQECICAKNTHMVLDAFQAEILKTDGPQGSLLHYKNKNTLTKFIQYLNSRMLGKVKDESVVKIYTEYSIPEILEPQVFVEEMRKMDFPTWNAVGNAILMSSSKAYPASDMEEKLEEDFPLMKQHTINIINKPRGIYCKVCGKEGVSEQHHLLHPSCPTSTCGQYEDSRILHLHWKKHKFGNGKVPCFVCKAHDVGESFAQYCDHLTEHKDETLGNIEFKCDPISSVQCQAESVTDLLHYFFHMTTWHCKSFKEIEKLVEYLNEDEEENEVNVQSEDSDQEETGSRHLGNLSFLNGSLDDLAKKGTRTGKSGRVGEVNPNPPRMSREASKKHLDLDLPMEELQRQLDKRKRSNEDLVQILLNPNAFMDSVIKRRFTDMKTLVEEMRKGKEAEEILGKALKKKQEALLIAAKKPSSDPTKAQKVSKTGAEEEEDEEAEASAKEEEAQGEIQSILKHFAAWSKKQKTKEAKGINKPAGGSRQVNFGDSKDEESRRNDGAGKRSRDDAETEQEIARAYLKNMENEDSSDEGFIVCRNEFHESPPEFNSEDEKVVHIMRSHYCPMKNTPKSCSYYTEMSKDMVEHVKTVHDDKNAKKKGNSEHQCEICLAYLATKGHKELHINTMHSLKCKICNDRFGHRSELLAHTCPGVMPMAQTPVPVPVPRAEADLSVGADLSKREFAFIDMVKELSTLVHGEGTSKQKQCEELVQGYQDSIRQNKNRQVKLFGEWDDRPELFICPEFNMDPHQKENLAKSASGDGTPKAIFNPNTDNTKVSAFQNYVSFDNINNEIIRETGTCNLRQSTSVHRLLDRMTEEVRAYLRNSLKGNYDKATYGNVLTLIQARYVRLDLRDLLTEVDAIDRDRQESLEAYYDRVGAIIRLASLNFKPHERPAWQEEQHRRRIFKNLPLSLKSQIMAHQETVGEAVGSMALMEAHWAYMSRLQATKVEQKLDYAQICNITTEGNKNFRKMGPQGSNNPGAKKKPQNNGGAKPKKFGGNSQSQGGGGGGSMKKPETKSVKNIATPPNPPKTKEPERGRSKSKPKAPFKNNSSSNATYQYANSNRSPSRGANGYGNRPQSRGAGGGRGGSRAPSPSRSVRRGATAGPNEGKSRSQQWIEACQAALGLQEGEKVCFRCLGPKRFNTDVHVSKECRLCPTSTKELCHMCKKGYHIPSECPASKGQKIIKNISQGTSKKNQVCDWQTQSYDEPSDEE